MRKPEDYRAEAARCRERAVKTRDPDVKATFEEMARQWDSLAKKVEQHLP
jgi:hypothetical protein